MNIFLDANILVSVLNKEYPLFSYSSRIVSLADHKNFNVYTSPVCLAIAFYFAEKKSGTTVAKKKMQLLVSKFLIAEVGQNEVMATAQNKMVDDFEDGLEYYAAINSSCNVIVTENKKDFYFSEIEILNAEEFVLKYLLHQ
ncbi:MAG TPA: PIN domain-containing protein [Ferruginibacter sp.]|nr:PIN domain-containing protein [Ferruginibacter sp.]HRE62977.1 PIN domain-containing protein [Ferruginibacter sp.]